MLTSLSESEAMLEGINAGADDYITKSADFNVLTARLKAQLRRRQFEDENRGFREQLLRSEMEALEMRAVRELAETRAAHISDLEGKNEELRRAKEEADALAREMESFSYSVSHDLRAPLRSIDGFSLALVEDCGSQLDQHGHGLLAKVRAGVKRMNGLINDMLDLAKVSRKEMNLAELDPLGPGSPSGRGGAGARRPQRKPCFRDRPQALLANGDRGLLRIVLENLMGNAMGSSLQKPVPRASSFSPRLSPRAWFSR